MRVECTLRKINGNYYPETYGFPMDGPTSSIFADIVMTDLKRLNKLRFKPIVKKG